MKGSLFLGKIFGIKLYVHFTFLLLFLYIGYYSYDAFHSFERLGTDFLIILVAFVFVIMHEFGHALAARRVGIQTRQILILPIGGMAQLNNMPENPKDELFVTFCGPAVNLALIVILLPIYLLTHSYGQILSATDLSDDWVAIMLGINIILFVFNLVPAFPMDGGRIFRALLAFRLSYVRATLIAARTGQAIAIGVFAYFISLDFRGEVDLLSIIKLLVLCVFIVVLAGMEYAMVKRKAQMGYYDMPLVQSPSGAFIHSGHSISEAIHEISRNGKTQIPVVSHNEVAGMVSTELPEKYIGFSPRASHTWQSSPQDTLGHALKMMEILGIPMIALGISAKGSREVYLFRDSPYH